MKFIKMQIESDEYKRYSMECVEFITKITNLESPINKEMENILVDKYLLFHFINKDNISKKQISEKLYDFIEKIMIKTGKSFDELLTVYVDAIGKFVEQYLSKECVGKDSKGKSIYKDSRAIKYFKEVKNRIKSNDDFDALVDYSRIIFCLYSEIIRNKYKSIIDFDYSIEGIDCESIMSSIESKEKDSKTKIIKLPELPKKSKVFDNYNIDSFVKIVSIMMLSYLKSKETRGNDNE